MKLIIEVAEGYYKWLEIKKRDNRANVAEITILDGIPYEGRSQGKWIAEHVTTLYGKCNQCGEICEVDNFCSNCGADMRGNENVEGCE